MHVEEEESVRKTPMEHPVDPKERPVDEIPYEKE
jgi:hypothetical protein